jgi:hypothetical protein
MAAYVAEGKRIPRRGEIGLTSDEIDQYENVSLTLPSFDSLLKDITIFYDINNIIFLLFRLGSL